METCIFGQTSCPGAQWEVLRRVSWMYNVLMNKRPSDLLKDSSSLPQKICLSFTDDGEVLFWPFTEPESLDSISRQFGRSNPTEQQKWSWEMFSTVSDKAFCKVSALHNFLCVQPRFERIPNPQPHTSLDLMMELIAEEKHMIAIAMSSVLRRSDTESFNLIFDSFLTVFFFPQLWYTYIEHCFCGFRKHQKKWFHAFSCSSALGLM